MSQTKCCTWRRMNTRQISCEKCNSRALGWKSNSRSFGSGVMVCQLSNQGGCRKPDCEFCIYNCCNVVDGKGILNEHLAWILDLTKWNLFWVKGIWSDRMYFKTHPEQCCAISSSNFGNFFSFFVHSTVARWIVLGGGLIQGRGMSSGRGPRHSSGEISKPPKKGVYFPVNLQTVTKALAIFLRCFSECLGYLSVCNSYLNSHWVGELLLPWMLPPCVHTQLSLSSHCLVRNFVQLLSARVPLRARLQTADLLELELRLGLWRSHVN